ncbi:MAG TPA: TraB/GumN family protein [Sphingobacteriaceae bacterium]|nr:TraB/GumN family protein [Sphingobacteriaceae bacterium]
MKKIYFLIVFTLSFLRLSAQQNLQYAKDSNSLLWEISGKNLKDTSYLFGTYHFVGQTFIDTLPAIYKVFKQAKIIVGEMKMENEVLMAAQLMPQMIMSGHKLDEILSPSEYQIVNNYLIKVSGGLHLNMLNTLKPSAVLVTIMGFISPVKTAPGEKLIDIYFQQEGEKLKKKVIGLETISEQARFLFGLPIKRQKEILLKTIKHADKQEQHAKEVFKFYKTQDLENLRKAFGNYNHYTNKELNVLMKNRNEIWMKKIPAVMEAGSSFIAVGGGHLIGKNGLINLLQKAGYNIRPINARI